MQITVHYLNGKSHQLSFQPTDTIQTLKNHFPSPHPPQLLYQGRIQPNTKLLSTYNLTPNPSPHLYLISNLHGGGNDGGSIPTRGEMVKTKKNTKKPDQMLINRVKWFTCAISKLPLVSPVVADELGNVFNKEVILKCLIEKSMPLRFRHVRSLKSVHLVQFTLNESHDPSKPMQYGMDDFSSPYQCLITGRPVNGHYAFSLIKTCGHVFSEKGLKKTEMECSACYICQTPYTKDDILPLNSDEETQEALKVKLRQEQFLLEEKKNEKKKKNSEKKQSEKEEKAPLKRKAEETKSSKNLKKPRATAPGPTLQNALSVKVALEKAGNTHDAKKRSSEAYKSIFSNSSLTETLYFTGVSRGVIK